MHKTLFVLPDWYEFVTNVEVATISQLPSINEAISRRRHSLCGHVRRMDQAAPAHQALHLSVTSRQGSGQLGSWSVATDPSAWKALRPVDGQVQRERERERERERTMPLITASLARVQPPLWRATEWRHLEKLIKT